MGKHAAQLPPLARCLAAMHPGHPCMHSPKNLKLLDTLGGSIRNHWDIFSSFFGNYSGWEAVNKSAASAASPDYVKFQAVIKSAASAASLAEAALAADLITPFFVLQFLAVPAAKK